MPKQGDPIPLSMKLFDSNGSVFVLATVKDNFGVSQPGSPISLTYVGLGKYENYSLTMPGSVDLLSVTYQVFTDSAHTMLDLTYTEGVDIFPLDTSSCEIITLLMDIQTQIAALPAIINSSAGAQTITGILNAVGAVKDLLCDEDFDNLIEPSHESEQVVCDESTEDSPESCGESQ